MSKTEDEQEKHQIHFKMRSCYSKIYIAGALTLSILGVTLITIALTNNNLKINVLSLTTGTKVHEIFMEAPFNTYLNVYFFNWTNPQEFHDLTKKPQLKEIGPFKFLGEKNKVNVVFHENNTVSFDRKGIWHFLKDESPYDLDTRITSINPILVTLADQLKDTSIITKMSFITMLDVVTKNATTTSSVRKMLFHGYEDQIIKILDSFEKKKKHRAEKFGWFYEKNGSTTYDGHFNVGDGRLSNLGQVLNWNYMNHTPYFPGKCGEVRGAADKLYPRHLKTKYLELFSSELCRTIKLDFVGKTTTKMIKGYEFTIGNLSLDNGELFPENECYCNGECVPYGMMNISSCRYDMPIFASLPHFRKADPSLRSHIEGMNPTNDHEFYVIFEPKTGLPLEAATRVQINLKVEKIADIRYLDNINDVYFPILWYEEVLTTPISYVMGLLWLLWFNEIFFVSGLAFLAVGTSMLFYKLFKMYKIYKSSS